MTRGTVKFSRQRLLGNVEPKTFPHLPLPLHSWAACHRFPHLSRSHRRLSASRIISLCLVFSLVPFVSASLHISLSLSLGFFRLSLFLPIRGARVDSESSRLVFLFVPASLRPFRGLSLPLRSRRLLDRSTDLEAYRLRFRDKQFDALSSRQSDDNTQLTQHRSLFLRHPMRARARALS